MNTLIRLLKNIFDISFSASMIIDVRAFSSVGRASPLQGEGQKFESSNAHHRNPDNICYLDFYFESFDSKNSF